MISSVWATMKNSITRQVKTPIHLSGDQAMQVWQQMAEPRQRLMLRAALGRMEMTRWFCAAVTTMSSTLAYATDDASRTGFDQASWLLVKG